MNAPRFMKEYAAYAKKKIMAYPAGTDAEKERQNEMCDHIDKYVKNYELGLLTVTEVMNEISLWVWRVQ